MAATEPRVIKTSADAMQNANGEYVNAIKVEFRIGEDGPFYVKVPAKEFTADNVKAQLQAFALQHAGLPR